MFECVGILTQSTGDGVSRAFQATLSVLEKRECTVYFLKDTPRPVVPEKYSLLEISEFADNCDLVISVGGDGTLLHTAGLLYPKDVALMGINLGRLGFLTDLQPERVTTELDAILGGAFQTEKRSVLGYEVYRGDSKIVEGNAVNDVVIHKWNIAKLITLSTYVNKKFLHSQRSDGILVATPTGSTAYALSGGGPILEPDVAALALVPICPHTLTNRPIVINDNAQIEIFVDTETEDEARLTCDGNFKADLKAGDRINIFQRKQKIRLIHPADHDHFSNLRAKLNWGRSPC